LRGWSDGEAENHRVGMAPEVRARSSAVVMEHRGAIMPHNGSDRLDRGEIRLHRGDDAEKGVRHAERDRGLRAGADEEEREADKALEEGETAKYGQANEILRKASAYLRRRSSTAGEAMKAFIDDQSGRLRGRADLPLVLPIAPSTYHVHAARVADRAIIRTGPWRDAAMRSRSRGYGKRTPGIRGAQGMAGKAAPGRGWQLPAARRAADAQMGLAVRSARAVKTTSADRAAPSPIDG